MQNFERKIKGMSVNRLEKMLSTYKGELKDLESDDLVNEMLNENNKYYEVDSTIRKKYEDLLKELDYLQNQCASIDAMSSYLYQSTINIGNMYSEMETRMVAESSIETIRKELKEMEEANPNLNIQRKINNDNGKMLSYNNLAKKIHLIERELRNKQKEIENQNNQMQ